MSESINILRSLIISLDSRGVTRVDYSTMLRVFLREVVRHCVYREAVIVTRIREIYIRRLNSEFHREPLTSDKFLRQETSNSESHGRTFIITPIGVMAETRLRIQEPNVNRVSCFVTATGAVPIK